MTEFKLSLAPRSQMKSSFLPLPMPAAKACFMTSGISTSVDKAMARLDFADALKNDRRLMILRLQLELQFWCCIKSLGQTAHCAVRTNSLLLESLRCQQKRDHAADAVVVA